mmetsp:Transcript_5627/g.16083  ORF Transcript_5627/g.16083 Transcript_5627/m.16083 type:complete len:406 (-) Transcript_5627:1425-2642(-)
MLCNGVTAGAVGSWERRKWLKRGEVQADRSAVQADPAGVGGEVEGHAAAASAVQVAAAAPSCATPQNACRTAEAAVSDGAQGGPIASATAVEAAHAVGDEVDVGWQTAIVPREGVLVTPLTIPGAFIPTDSTAAAAWSDTGLPAATLSGAALLTALAARVLVRLPVYRLLNLSAPGGTPSDSSTAGSFHRHSPVIPAALDVHANADGARHHAACLGGDTARPAQVSQGLTSLPSSGPAATACAAETAFTTAAAPALASAVASALQHLLLGAGLRQAAGLAELQLRLFRYRLGHAAASCAEILPGFGLAVGRVCRAGARSIVDQNGADAPAAASPRTRSNDAAAAPSAALAATTAADGLRVPLRAALAAACSAPAAAAATASTAAGAHTAAAVPVAAVVTGNLMLT